MKRGFITAGALALGLAASANERPNIIVVLADDLGFSDLGCYGGEINTPTLNKMAEDGLRLTQMYNASRSCPSRACLMTGLYPHQTGLGHMAANRPKWPKGYAGFRSDSDNVTIAEVMKEAGYFTAMSGKWHLGNIKPTERGFDEYFGLLGGFNSMWKESVYTRLPKGHPTREYAKGEFYATNAITDYAIDFINQANEVDKPLFMYLAYNAPHFPLHAPKEAIDKYVDIYSQGWDKIRDQRWERIVDMDLLQGKPEMSPRGVVPESFFIHEQHDLPSWDSLSAEQQADLARRMATFAAMVDIMDSNFGRVIETLEKRGELDNTFIVFMSDNGACAEWHEFGFDGHTGLEYTTHVGEEQLNIMGQPESYMHYGTGWANVGCTPFTLYKHYSHEGGISTPCIVRWGDNIKNKGGIDYQPAQFSDIMSTCVELAQTEYPTTYKGRKITPTAGTSILPIVKGKKLDKRYIYNEHEGNRMVRYGDWKLVASNSRGDDWELYNIKEDRTEQHNLAAKYPKKVAELEKAYFEWADRSDVLYFPKMWNEYGNTKQVILKEYKDR